MKKSLLLLGTFCTIVATTTFSQQTEKNEPTIIKHEVTKKTLKKEDIKPASAQRIELKSPKRAEKKAIRREIEIEKNSNDQ